VYSSDFEAEATFGIADFTKTPMFLVGTLVAFLSIYFWLFFKGKLGSTLPGRIAGYIFNWSTIPFIAAVNAFVPSRFPSDVDETLILGAQPSWWDVEALSKKNVRAVINMCDEYNGPVQTYREFGIVQLKLPTIDHTEPELRDIEEAIRFIEEQRSQGGKVYVHCRAGRGRSGAIAFCWVAKQNLSFTALQVQERLLLARPMVRKQLFLQPNVNLFLDKLGKETLAPTPLGSNPSRLSPPRPPSPRKNGKKKDLNHGEV